MNILLTMIITRFSCQSTQGASADKLQVKVATILPRVGLLTILEINAFQPSLLNSRYSQWGDYQADLKTEPAGAPGHTNGCLPSKAACALG